MKTYCRAFSFISVLAIVVAFLPKHGGCHEPINNNFISVIKEAKPAIVTILVKKLPNSAKDNNHNHQDFFNNDLIKEFLGPIPDRPNQERPEPTATWGNGSGFIIHEDGYIVTNHHVVKDGVTFTVFLQDKRSYKAELIGSDSLSDIALLRIDESNLPTVTLGNSNTLQVGEWAIAIGSPVEFIQTVTVGIISAKGRSSIGISEYEDFIQTDAAINPGNSGGPLLNIHGEVIGINTAFITQKGGFMGIGFAIPISMAKIIVSQLKKNGQVERGWLGVSLKNSEPSEILSLHHPRYKNAAKVLKINNNSPANTAGFKKNDLIVAVNRKDISGAADLRNKIAMTEPGSLITIQFFRNKALREAQVTIVKK